LITFLAIFLQCTRLKHLFRKTKKKEKNVGCVDSIAARIALKKLGTGQQEKKTEQFSEIILKNLPTQKFKVLKLEKICR
jgi:HD-like signal output (HDOD) protein